MDDALHPPLERAVRTNLRRRGCALVLIGRRRGSLELCDRLIGLERGRLTAVELSPDGDAVWGDSGGQQRAGEPEARYGTAEEKGPVDPWLRPCRGLPAALQRVGEAVDVEGVPEPSDALPGTQRLAH